MPNTHLKISLLFCPVGCVRYKVSHCVVDFCAAEDIEEAISVMCSKRRKIDVVVRSGRAALERSQSIAKCMGRDEWYVLIALARRCHVYRVYLRHPDIQALEGYGT